MAPFLANLMRAQTPRPTVYAEPFAGGAGAALRLLVDSDVQEIRINDLDPGIAAFWRSVFFDTDRFARKITDCKVTMTAWRRHRAVYLSPEGRTDLELGFAAFFLNRCNRSGIIGARPIGGIDQSGQWKLDARFNAVELAKRVRYLGAFRDRVRVTQLDARVFLNQIADDPDPVLVYVDPPYIVQGDQLYLDKLSYADHRDLALQLRASQFRWLLTYDCDGRITDELYPDLRCASFNIAHTAQVQHIGREYAVFSDNLVVNDMGILPRETAQWVV
ncbi:DNA methyltransferase [Knoellia aerolata DSM 18566]|uniref:site-specific DNA-methyltransferase (adenine-specific) n=2 Tax=Knoellia TaxID=136099 RepID=A0A0A0K250_9MICO|nr:DNA methyltransferase [Knoellia aerolata DSM 18566]